MTAAPNPPLRIAAGISRPGHRDVSEDSAVTHAQDFTMRLTPTKFENIIDLATRGEPPLVTGFKS
jgi:hypothetical protein